MIGAAKYYFLIFGLLTILGGIIGFTKGSTISLVAGAVAGVLLLLAGYLVPTNTTAGLAIGLIVSIALAAQFTPKFFKTASFMPAGVMSILSLIGLVVAIVAFIKR
jgi:uncharacterized membrane protein (UPF0136 family)